MNYFAYGSNMPTRCMAEWCSSFSLIGAAQLWDFRLAFNKPSTHWGGAAADVVAAPGHSVWGVLWEIDEASRVSLDEKETLGVAYAHSDLPVQTRDGQGYEALVYTVIHKRVPELRPSRSYLDVLIEGAEEHQLPPEYIAWLRSVEIDAQAPYLIDDRRPPPPTRP